MTKGKGLDGVERLARNIVEVDINLRKYKTTTLQNRQNVYAMPQTIVRITAPSVAHLRQFLSASGSRLIGFLVRTELSRAQGLLERNHNKEAILKMKRMFGMSMLVPSDMTASKQSRDFLWLSNNASTGMASFCLYYVYKGKEFRQQRDSVMRRNIPGEKFGMYMMTAVMARREVNPGRSTTIRGLWEMRNDDMGGPFIAYLPERLARGNRQLVAETFLFAPESRKRNLLRRMEAALYTIHQ